MKDLLFFLRLAARQRWFLGGALIAFTTLFAGTALLGLSGWFISAAALAGLAGTGAAFNLFVPSSGVRFFAIGRIVSRYLERLVTHEATLRILSDLRVWFFRKAIPLAPARLGGCAAGRGGAGDHRYRGLDNLYLRALAPGTAALLITLAAAGFLALYSPARPARTAGHVGGWHPRAPGGRTARPPSGKTRQGCRGPSQCALDGLKGAELIAHDAAAFALAELNRAGGRLSDAQRRQAGSAGSAAPLSSRRPLSPSCSCW